MMSTDQSEMAEWLAALLRRPAWHRKAACRGMGTDAFFPVVGGNAATARAVCGTCPVTRECLNAALQSDSVGVGRDHRQGPSSDASRGKAERRVVTHRRKSPSVLVLRQLIPGHLQGKLIARESRGISS